MRIITDADLQQTRALIDGDREGDRLPCFVHKPSASQLDEYDDVSGSTMTILLMVVSAISGALVVLLILTLTGRLR